MLTLLPWFHGQIFGMTDKIVILSTCSTAEEGEQLARLLLDARLAACVSIIPRMRSLYHWKDAIESSEECLLLIKSSRDLFQSVRARLEAAHSYEVPELLAIPVVEGSANYMNWLDSILPAKTKGE
jgi:periplasmic divalent cation tolerance protein